FAAVAGGILGWNYEEGTVSNCFANATVSAYGYEYYNHFRGYAGLISGWTGGTIENCIAMGSVVKANGTASDISTGGTITNCYRAAGTTITKDTKNYKTYATEQSLDNLSRAIFYEVSLGWDSSVWNYNNVSLSRGIYPTLRQNII
ncbi:MAG: hypothetical protein IJF71_03540, partial [Clostridia bacterium]|nr:hypothetical protein [Clostridia bacterium]